MYYLFFVYVYVYIVCMYVCMYVYIYTYALGLCNVTINVVNVWVVHLFICIHVLELLSNFVSTASVDYEAQDSGGLLSGF